MDFKLGMLEKRSIVDNYGLNVKGLNKAQRILNDLGIVDEREDFYELLCLIALEYEAMQDMKKNYSQLARRCLLEVIAGAIYEKYGNLEELAPSQRCKAKIFINQFGKVQQ